jgi:glycopeptide antibiotics resistance protein
MLNINWLGAIYMLIPIIIILLLLEKDIKRVKYISLGGSFVLLIFK